MSNDRALRALLVKILGEHTLKGATLKPLLEQEYHRESGERFELSRFGYAKFRHLLDAFADIIEVIPADGPGDMVVRLRRNEGGIAQHMPASDHDKHGERWLPTHVWLAFTNPDPKRVRFMNRQTGVIIHYDPDCPTHGDRFARTTHERNPDDYVQIEPISQAIQLGWMKTFLHEFAKDASDFAAAERLLEDGYTSELNTKFTTAISPYGRSYHQLRASKVIAHVREWCTRNGVDFQTLIASDRLSLTASQTATPAPRPALAKSRKRETVHYLVDQLSEDELGTVYPSLCYLLTINAVRP